MLPLPKEWTIRFVKMQTLFIIQSIPSVVDLNKYKINQGSKLNILILTVGSIIVNIKPIIMNIEYTIPYSLSISRVTADVLDQKMSCN